MKTDLDAARIRADSAASTAEEFAWPLAIAFATSAYLYFESILISIALVPVIYVMSTRPFHKECSRLWAIQDDPEAQDD